MEMLNELKEKETEKILMMGKYEIIADVDSSFEGSYILLAIKKKRNENFVLKIVNKKVETEKYILQLAHKNRNNFIVDCLETFELNQSLCMVLEDIPQGCLRVYSLREGDFSTERSVFYAANIVLALEFLHLYHIYHRDVSLENILLCYDGYVKLCDFDFSIITSRYSASYDMYDTMRLCDVVCEMCPSMQNLIEEIPKESLEVLKKNDLFQMIDWEKMSDKKYPAPPYKPVRRYLNTNKEDLRAQCLKIYTK